MIEEEFRPIIGFPDYSVSRSGRVMSLPRKIKTGRYESAYRVSEKKELATREIRPNHFEVSIRRDKKTIIKNVKTLVREAFPDEQE